MLFFIVHQNYLSSGVAAFTGLSFTTLALGALKWRKVKLFARCSASTPSNGAARVTQPHPAPMRSPRTKNPDALTISPTVRSA